MIRFKQAILSVILVNILTREEEALATDEQGHSWHLNSSNQRKFTTVLIGLKVFRSRIQRSSCLVIRTDNVVKEITVTKWSAKKELFQIARRIRMEAVNQDLKLTTEHLPKIQNSKADALSFIARKEDYIVKKEFLCPALAEPVTKSMA
ncbi:MAG: hypothetical protein EZS28_030055 [Streblomastix strix]|uniref:RNase H type-1 domain-containing protein n=1 Tax=Streblomastix strix TaxID=222440 RepID=A0A5J4UVE5_9EUKA|nr:MAG: hypothetical protein EZS28_030055 [Streblomastix strix]